MGQAGHGLATWHTSSAHHASGLIQGSANAVAVVIRIANGAGTVTPPTISLQQATDVSGTSSRSPAVLASVRGDRHRTRMTCSRRVEFSSSIFTADSTSSKNLLYVIDVPLADRDRGFDCLRLKLGDAVGCMVSAFYLLHEFNAPDPWKISFTVDGPT